MKLFLTILTLAAAALAAPDYEPIQLHYHSSIGIPAAARIKAAEEATDFDGARILGGNYARLGQFPYMGGLVISLPGGLTSVCGSTLLTTSQLVTAAHCWFDGEKQALELTVALGTMYLFWGGTRAITNKVVMHENYDPISRNNDIAMIQISAVALNTYINTVRPASGSNTFAGEMALATGYGSINDTAGIAFFQVLSYVSLPVISNEECQRTFGPYVTASTLCASGANGRSTCTGDSGGPLVIDDVLVGVKSFGATTCEGGHPIGFSRVTNFHSWISQHLKTYAS